MARPLLDVSAMISSRFGQAELLHRMTRVMFALCASISTTMGGAACSAEPTEGWPDSSHSEAQQNSTHGEWLSTQWAPSDWLRLQASSALTGIPRDQAIVTNPRVESVLQPFERDCGSGGVKGFNGYLWTYRGIWLPPDLLRRIRGRFQSIREIVDSSGYALTDPRLMVHTPLSDWVFFASGALPPAPFLTSHLRHKRIVDLGCGKGGLMIEMNARGSAWDVPFDFRCVDEILANHQTPENGFIRSSIRNKGVVIGKLGKGQTDLVIMTNSIIPFEVPLALPPSNRSGPQDNIAPIRDVLDIMWALLKPGGQVVLGGYRNDWGPRAVATTVRIAQQKGFGVNQDLTGNSLDALQQLRELIAPPIADDEPEEMIEYYLARSRDALSLMTSDLEGVTSDEDYPYLRELALELIDEKVAAFRNNPQLQPYHYLTLIKPRS
jgi:SAM-dependent methyltransferase